MKKFLRMISVCLLVTGEAVLRVSALPQVEASRPFFSPWIFHDDFSHGIPAWMSYPLVQDIGYDPTLYTKKTGGASCLVRNVPSLGQHVLRVGMIKPLQFHASYLSSFNLQYEVAVGGPIKWVRFMLAGENGHLYELTLPDSPGLHTVREIGKSLALPATGVEVQAVILEAVVQSPAKGSANRLILRQLEIAAQRTAELPLVSPKLVRSSAGGPWFDAVPLNPGASLLLRVESKEPIKVQAFDNESHLVPNKLSPAGKAFPPGAYIVTFLQRVPGFRRVIVADRRAQTEFWVLVVGSVPRHPRAYLSSVRLQELRNLSHSTPLFGAVLTQAQSLRARLTCSPKAGNWIAAMSTVSVFPGLPGYFRLLENYSNAISFNAVAYALSGSETAFEAARCGLLTVSEWPTWTPPWFAAHGLHTYYEVGVFSQRAAIGYDLIADRLTQKEKSIITQAAYRNAIEPTVEEYFLMDRMPIAASNWMANSVGGALACVAALYGDTPQWTGRLGTALVELAAAYEHLLTGLFPGDGSEAEPAGYEAFAMEGMACGTAALRAFHISLPQEKRMVEGFWWLRYAEVTPDLVLDTGDFGGQLRGLSGFAWEAEYGGDPSLRAFYDTAEVGTLVGISKVQHTGRLLEMAPGILDLVCCSTPPPVAPAPPPSKIFPGRGSAVLRSGWKPTDTAISIRVGPWFNHEHHDQGSFQVAALGEKLISEAGYADYYRDPNYPTYFMQAPGHNTVLVNEDTFSQPGEDGRYWKALAQYPHFTTHLFSPAMDYLSAELAEAYDGALNQFRREFIFLKPDVLIVKDELHASNAHTYQWLLHIPMGDATRIDGSKAAIIGRKALVRLAAAGWNTHWTLTATPVASDRLVGDNHPVNERAYEFRLQSPSGKFAHFLVGMTFNRRAEQTVAPAVISDDHREGFRLVNSKSVRTVLFRTAPGALEIGPLSTDGRILGTLQVQSHETIFAADARTVNGNGQTIVAASSPVLLLLQRSAHGMKLRVWCGGVTRLRLQVPTIPRTVLVDGRQTAPEIKNGFLELSNLTQGEHLVRIVT